MAKDGNIMKYMIYIVGLLLIISIYAFSFVPVHYQCTENSEYVEYYGVAQNIDLLFGINRIEGTIIQVYENKEIEVDTTAKGYILPNCRLI